MELHGGHLRILRHCAPNRFGSMTEMSSDLHDLVEAGYMMGKWCGSLDYPAFPVWTITQDGEKALKEYDLAQLRSSTKQCPPGECQYAYGEEVYLRANCVTCGRNIEPGKGKKVGR